jgi:hypothetical protein
MSVVDLSGTSTELRLGTSLAAHIGKRFPAAEKFEMTAVYRDGRGGPLTTSIHAQLLAS